MIARTFGSGTPLVVVHGFGVDHRIMLPLEDMVGARQWQRIYIDLPWAEGARDSGAATPRDLADAVLAEVRDTIGEQSFAIIGNSFGGMIARHVAHALAARCIGVATLAGVFQLDHALRQLPEHRVVVPDATVVAHAGAAGDDFAELAVVQTPDTLRAFREFVLPGLHGAAQDVLDRLSATYADGYVPEHGAAEPFSAPALHIFGRQDQVVGFDDGLAFRNHYTRGSFVVLDTAGHNLHLEQPEVVGALVREWLDRAELHGA